MPTSKIFAAAFFIGLSASFFCTPSSSQGLQDKRVPGRQIVPVPIPEVTSPEAAAVRTLNSQSVRLSSGTSTIVGPGDLITVTVFDVPELSGSFRVNADGEVSFPLVGVLVIKGRDTIAIEEQLRNLLIAKHLVLDPQVSVQIVEFASQGITVAGEVKIPGIYPDLGSHRVIDILALAGGTTLNAGNVVTVSHRNSNKQEEIPLRDGFDRLSTATVGLRQGDVVVVQRAGIVYVLGDVGRPGGYILDRANITTLQALTFAQGYTRTSSLTKTRILRLNKGIVTATPIDLKALLRGKVPDLLLHDGDVLYVPESGGKALFQASTNGFLSSIASASIYATTR